MEAIGFLRIAGTRQTATFGRLGAWAKLLFFIGPPDWQDLGELHGVWSINLDSDRPSGTEGYADEVEVLVKQYESIAFDDVHRDVLHLIPSVSSRILDIGSGTGRDAAGFAAMGHRVTAVEPTAELRARAAALHPSPRIEWLDDSLPGLTSLAERRFDVVMLTAVWMHLDERQRRQAMPRAAGLVRSGGLMILSLRYGPVPPGRRMFDVTATETIGLAQAEGLDPVLRLDRQQALLGTPGVSWTRLAFRNPQSSV
jgi:SAM-dependent methyltransferase